MIFAIAIVTFALSFVALFFSSVSDVIWFKLVISVVLSAVLAMLVTANLYY